MVKKNGFAVINRGLSKSFESDDDAIAYMTSHKAETGLRFIETEQPWEAPDYIARALR
jgi:putative ATP-dependent endonuclease of OLD family